MNTELSKVQKDISASVLNKVNQFEKSGQIKLPKDYSAENALKAAMLILNETENKNKQKALEHCTKDSIANALLKMVVWGLSPLKKQCDFIMYGNKLDCSIEYTGNIALAKRYGGLISIKSNAVFEGEEFEFETHPNGTKSVVKHKQTLDSIGSKKVIGAYAVIQLESGVTDTEIMSISQIKDAWNQGAMKGGSPAHKNFPDQMAMKTVINRACKPLIRSSSDAVLYDGTETDKTIDVAYEDVSEEVETKANKDVLEVPAL